MSSPNPPKSSVKPLVIKRSGSANNLRIRSKNVPVKVVQESTQVIKTDTEQHPSKRSQPSEGKKNKLSSMFLDTSIAIITIFFMVLSFVNL